MDPPCPRLLDVRLKMVDDPPGIPAWRRRVTAAARRVLPNTDKNGKDINVSVTSHFSMVDKKCIDTAGKVVPQGMINMMYAPPLPSYATMDAQKGDYCANGRGNAAVLPRDNPMCFEPWEFAGPKSDHIMNTMDDMKKGDKTTNDMGTWSAIESATKKCLGNLGEIKTDLQEKLSKPEADDCKSLSFI